MKRTATIWYLALATTLTGCLDLGLEGNVPLEEAVDRPASDLVTAVYGPAGQSQQLVADGRLWVPAGLPQGRSGAGLRAVGAANGRTVFARSWDDAPYDALFTELTSDGASEDIGAGPRADAEWQGWVPVSGRTGALPGSGAAADPGQTGAGGHDGVEAEQGTVSDTAGPGH